MEVKSFSHRLCSDASRSVAVGQVELYQAFSLYTGGGHAAELPFYTVTEINAGSSHGRVCAQSWGSGKCLWKCDLFIVYTVGGTSGS